MSTVNADLTARSIDANELRALAEASDGLRNTDAYLVEHPVGTDPAYSVMSKAEADANNLRCVIKLRTEDKPKPITRDEVQLRSIKPIFCQGVEVDVNRFDAIFTSLSALEKFVVPYYARIKPLADCESFRSTFAEATMPVAALHLPSSVQDIGMQKDLLFAALVDDSLQLMTPQQFIKFV